MKQTKQNLIKILLKYFDKGAVFDLVDSVYPKKDSEIINTTVIAEINNAALNHAALSKLDWLNSGHTGTADKIAAFDSDGNATEVDASSGSGLTQQQIEGLI